MLLSDFAYELPEELIAQAPAAERQASRMLVVDRGTSRLDDDRFSHFPERLRPDDVLVLNNTRVFPARLFGVSDTGAAVEIFLIEEISQSRWEALARPARRLKPGKRVSFGAVAATIVENRGDGHVIVDFEYAGDLHSLFEEIGATPLPPYIKRAGDVEQTVADRERYQTVYARTSGAIAAPTAGLHFTGYVLDAIRARGVEIVEITLHVGYGTFEPVRASDLAEHKVLPERYDITEEAASKLNAAKGDARRIVAVGTTTTRTLESAIGKHGRFVSGRGLADLTITPGYEFRAVDALLTNFHLPQSSLLILASTFGGHKLIMDAYAHAVAERYRFYSYGDCMFIQ